MGAEVSALVTDDEGDLLLANGGTVPYPLGGGNMDLSSAPAVPMSVEQILGDEARARIAFRRIWAECGPANGTAPRMRVCEVLLQAIRNFGGSADWEAQARRHLAKEFGGSFLPIGFEDARKLALKVFATLEKEGVKSFPVAISSPEAPSSPRSRSPTTSRPIAPFFTPSFGKSPGLGATEVDRKKPQVLHKFQTSASSMSMADENGREPNRAHLESLYMALYAEAAAKRTTCLRLQRQVEELRAATTDDSVSSSSRGGSVSFSSTSASASGRPSTCKSLEVVDERQAHATSNLEQLNATIARLKATLQSRTFDAGLPKSQSPVTPEVSFAEEREAWTQEMQVARRRVANKQAKLATAQSCVSDLERCAQTEQFRVVMLAGALEDHQRDMDHEMHEAETFLKTLEEDLQQAQDMEKSEEAIANDRAFTVTQVAASCAVDKITHEARHQKLMSELEQSTKALQALEGQVADAGLDVALGASTQAAMELQAARQTIGVEIQMVQRQGRDATAAVRQHQSDAAELRASLRNMESQLTDADGQLLLLRLATSIAGRGQVDFDGPREEMRARIRVEHSSLLKAELAETRAADEEAQAAEKLREAALSLPAQPESVDAVSRASASVSAAKALAKLLKHDLMEARSHLERGLRMNPPWRMNVANTGYQQDSDAQLVDTLEQQLGNALAGQAVGTCRIQELQVLQKIRLGGEPPTAPPSPSRRNRAPLIQPSPSLQTVSTSPAVASIGQGRRYSAPPPRETLIGVGRKPYNQPSGQRPSPLAAWAQLSSRT